jgi:S1-C subfamily serine protease
MSANEPIDPYRKPLDPDNEISVGGPKLADGAPLWSPEIEQEASAVGLDRSALDRAAAAAVPISPWAAPAAPPMTPPPPPAGAPTAGSPGYAWPGYPAPPYGTPPYGAPQYGGQQYGAQQPPYQQWATPPAPEPPPMVQSRQNGSARRLGSFVVAVALLSAALSAGGTYVAVSLAAKPAAVIVPSTAQNGNAQLISLTQTDAIIHVATAVKPSVVTITSDGTSNVSPFSVPSTGVGSGFIVTTNGLILTNNHVITGASTLTVTLDDTRQLPATVVATDAAHDLALIKIDATGLTAVTLGDSSSVQVGQLAIAIGSPLGTFTDSVTQGIISGTDRSITVGDRATRTEETLSGLLQTDAAINPGNSGGPLLDASGSVVGIITASASNAQDMGFAIPINQAKQMIAQATK